MDPLENISPIDGRYRAATEALAHFMSEGALIRHRVLVEGEYLIALAESGLTNLRELTADEQKQIRQLYDVPLSEQQVVKAIETNGYEGFGPTRHDVKAIEYYLKHKLKHASLADVTEYVHFGLTSEDINNLAYALMIKESIRDVLIPAISLAHDTLKSRADEHAGTPMLSRTHGQSASPTTVGKEFNVFAKRLEWALAKLEAHVLSVKFGGATGNFNAHAVAYPAADWLSFAESFVGTLASRQNVALKYDPVATQINPHDSHAELCNVIRQTNIVLTDCAEDMWRYISDGWFTQKATASETGSSAMPHKVNPINFENAEGNFGIANALLVHLSNTLPISRLQRDLSGSTVMRNVGVAFAHSLLGCQQLQAGLGKLSVNTDAMSAALAAHPEVLAEAIQTILRAENVEMPYEQLKELTRGKAVTQDGIEAFIENLSVSDGTKNRLKALTPEGYIGLAEKLARL